MKPEQRIVTLQHKHHLMDVVSGTVTTVSNEVGLTLSDEGGSGTARSRQSGGWDDSDW